MTRSVGDRLSDLIQKLNLNIKEFANLIGMNEGSVRGIIKGRVQSPSPEALQIMNSKFNVNLNWLLTGEGDMFIAIPSGDLSYKEKELLEYFRQNPEWLQNVALGALKGGETASELAKAISSLSEGEQKIVLKMIHGLQH